jgi:hypothetical protein
MADDAPDERPSRPDQPLQPTRPSRPAAPDRPSAPVAAPARSRSRPAKPAAGVEAARTTIPTCLVLGTLLPILAIIRFVAPEGSGWSAGPAALTWLMLFVGIIAMLGAVLLIRFVSNQLQSKRAGAVPVAAGTPTRSKRRRR